MLAKQAQWPAVAALTSAGLWVLATIILATSRGFQEGTSMHLIWILPTWIAVASFAVAVIGVFLRTGGLSGLWPMATLAFLALGTMLAFIGTWAWPLWGQLLAVASILPVLRLYSTNQGVRLMDWLLVAAWPIGTAMSLLLIALHVGPLDDEGDYPVATGLGFGVGAVLFATSLFLLGQRLRSEQMASHA